MSRALTTYLLKNCTIVCAIGSSAAIVKQFYDSFLLNIDYDS